KLPDAGSIKPFPDKAKFPDWAVANIETLQKTGLVKGDNLGNFNPGSKMTRAEIATVTMRFVEAVEAQLGDRTLREIVEGYLDENLCIAHTKLDVTFNYSGSLTEENLSALLKSEMGLGDEVTVTFNCDFDASFKGEENYGGMGDSGAGVLLPSAQNFFWPTSATSVTFKNEETGDAYTTEIDFSFHKVLCSAEIKGGKYANGVRSLCPDDWDKTFHGAEASLEAFKGTADSPYDFGSALTVGAIEEAARAATGLKNETKYPFFITGFDPTKTEEGMTINFGFINRDKEIPENVLDLIYVETFIKGTHRTLAEKIDDYLDENNCIAHTKLDYTFNYSSSLTAESLGALLKKEIGLPDTVEVDFDCDFNEFKDGYSQSGDGGYGSAPAGNAFHWADTVDVTFTDTATGEEYAVAIDFSIRKVLCSGELGYPGGVKSPCHEDWNGAFHALENKLAPFKNSGDDVLDYEGDLTPEGLEAKARELTGLTGAVNERDYPFFIVGYDAGKVNTGMGITFGFINRSDFVPDGDYLELIYVSTYIRQIPVIEPGVDLDAALDEFLDTYDCWVHPNTIHTTHTSGRVFTTEDLSKLFVEVMGLDPEIYSVEFDGFTGDPGNGDGEFVMTSKFDMWLVNKQTGEESKKVGRYIWSRKCLYSGVLAMYVCGDVADYWPDAEDKFDELVCGECYDSLEENLIHVLTPSLDAFNEESIKAMISEYIEGTDGVIIVPIEGRDDVIIFAYAETETEVIEITVGYVLSPVVDPSVEKPTLTAEHH
ncbi:MAG: S-layer homology domain-containing protein, partial [Clostridia bacterium]|nr:S-layer homology domain-containing protein [Clostridia bacterium]